MMSVRIALGQFNASVGDISANVEAIRKLLQDAKNGGVDVVIFPEMCVCGYPPEDLLHKKHFLDDTRAAVDALASEVSGIIAIVGFAEMSDGRCFNSLAVLQDGAIIDIYRKGVLPNYGVFDEKRYFDTGTRPLVVEIGGLNIVLSICEDIWDLEWFDNFLAGISSKDIIMNISASPFHLGKMKQRRKILGGCAKHFGCPVGYCNLVGGQDELVLDRKS
ncbi:MAG: NAD+ synthase, partial [Planctomycetes bacterium]|nr:NAD+ synthase [Planctomycetota bacterium]